MKGGNIMKLEDRELWQYRFVLSDEWATDFTAMNNHPSIKTFADYEKHVSDLNANTGENAECRRIMASQLNK